MMVMCIYPKLFLPTEGASELHRFLIMYSNERARREKQKNATMRKLGEIQREKTPSFIPLNNSYPKSTLKMIIFKRWK